MKNQKFYKEHGLRIFKMFPSDPTGSLDAFFLIKFLGVLWRTH